MRPYAPQPLGRRTRHAIAPPTDYRPAPQWV